MFSYLKIYVVLLDCVASAGCIFKKGSLILICIPIFSEK